MELMMSDAGICQYAHVTIYKGSTETKINAIKYKFTNIDSL